MMIVLKCLGCLNQVIVTEGCAGYCNKCHIQLQYDPWLTRELCGKENEKERLRLEKEAAKKPTKIKLKKSKHKKKKL
jgi:hypothetical protein